MPAKLLRKSSLTSERTCMLYEYLYAGGASGLVPYPSLQFGPQSLKAITRMCNVASAHSVHVNDKGSQNVRVAEY
jgi:hypothetical protein